MEHASYCFEGSSAVYYAYDLMHAEHAEKLRLLYGSNTFTAVESDLESLYTGWLVEL